MFSKKERKEQTSIIYITVYIYICTYIQRVRSREISVLLGYVFVQPMMKQKIRTNTSVNKDQIQKLNKQGNKHSRTNKQSNKKKELIKMVDNDDHNENEDEEVVVVHSSVVDDHSHKVQMEEVTGH